MKNNRILKMAAASMAIFLTLGAFTGCGSKSSSDVTTTYMEEKAAENTAGQAFETGETGDFSEASADQAGETGDFSEASAGDTEDAAQTETSESDKASDINQSARKLIVTWRLTMETETYEAAVSAVKESAQNSGGYLESEEESTTGGYNRYAYLTIRIPDEKAEEWITGVSSQGTITNRQKSTEDATLQYVDTESRLKALRTEQETLLDMMEKASDVSDLITIQSQLTEVNAEIESCESELRVLDNQVDYTTIYMDIEEVVRESAVSPSMGGEIRETFLNSLDHLKTLTRNILVGIIGNSVIIILAAAIIFVIVRLRKKFRKHHAKIKDSNKESKECGDHTENNREGRADH